jgi:DNA-binding NarL/FixJ family response regulator
MNNIKIVIVEDHAMFREGIISLLSQTNYLEIIAEYPSGEAFLKDLPTLCPEIVLMDIEMPGMNGIETTRKALDICPNLSIIALSMYNSQHYYFEMISAGVKGFVSKDSSLSKLEEAIKKVANNEHFFSTDMMRGVILKMGKQTSIPSSEKRCIHIFSEREFEVLNLLCQGLTNNQISEKLFLSPKTIESHKTKMIRKTGQHNSTGLIVYAIKNKLIEL